MTETSAPAGRTDPPAMRPPFGIRTLAWCYLAAILGLALLYLSWSALRSTLPASLGPLPLEVPWWGMLGGQVASLLGLHLHGKNWEDSYTLWHATRPLFSMATALLAVLFLQVVITLGSGKTAQSTLLLDAVAALAGLNDRLFQTLSRQVVANLPGSAPREQPAGDRAHQRPDAVGGCATPADCSPHATGSMVGDFDDPPSGGRPSSPDHPAP